jgi:hypothetical protein
MLQQIYTKGNDGKPQPSDYNLKDLTDKIHLIDIFICLF